MGKIRPGGRPPLTGPGDPVVVGTSEGTRDSLDSLGPGSLGLRGICSGPVVPKETSSAVGDTTGAPVLARTEWDGPGVGPPGDSSSPWDPLPTASTDVFT